MRFTASLSSSICLQRHFVARLFFPSTDRNDGNSKTDELTTPQRGNNNRRIMKRCSASAGKLLRAARQNATGAVLWNIGATHTEEEERRNDPLYTWLIIFTTTTSSIRSRSRPSSCSFAQLLRGGTDELWTCRGISITIRKIIVISQRDPRTRSKGL